MNLYSFHDPSDYTFAQATRHGTWYPSGAKICPECKTTRQKRVPPLIFEWEAGSDLIGDFIWPGLDTDLVVTQRVREAFEGRFREITFEPVEYWQNPKLKRPTIVTHRSKPRVWLPYMGPTLWDVIPSLWCSLDHVKSNVSITKVCSTCGTIIYKTPRWPQGTLIVDRDTWSGEDIFHIQEYSGGIFCTERVKEFVEQAGFTNVSFLEDGIIPD